MIFIQFHSKNFSFRSVRVQSNSSSVIFLTSFLRRLCVYLAFINFNNKYVHNKQNHSHSHQHRRSSERSIFDTFTHTHTRAKNGPLLYALASNTPPQQKSRCAPLTHSHFGNRRYGFSQTVSNKTHARTHTPCQTNTRALVTNLSSSENSSTKSRDIGRSRRNGSSTDDDDGGGGGNETALLTHH